MIYASASINSFPVSQLSLAGSGTRKLSLPVSPSSYIYSNFEHVSGVPAPEGTKGVAISKLKVLDVLLDQLSQLKSKKDPVYGNTGPLTEERIDALIDQYENEVRSARAASAAMPYKPRPLAPSGALFNLVA
jgi:hypothetical protein